MDDHPPAPAPPVETTWRALAAVLAAGEVLDPSLLHRIIPAPASPAEIGFVRDAPVITFSLDAENERDPYADLVLTADEVDAVVQSMARNPQASTTLAVLVRATESLPLGAAIQAESLAYGTLQAGHEFVRWLTDRTPVRVGSDTDEPVLVEHAPDSVIVTLNRPTRANALDARLRDALTAICDALAYSEAPVHLHGAGKHFCAGGDLAEFGMVVDPAHGHLLRMQRNLPAAVARLAGRLTAHVHGACIGAGMELSSFAQRVVAHPDCLWRLPEIEMGLIPGCGGTVSITRRIGRQRMLRLAVTGATLAAPTALAWGLIDEISR